MKFGVKKIFEVSIALHGSQAREPEVIIDTTVQEKNVTFPTDTKLRVRVMACCWKLASKENIQLRRSYRRELKRAIRTIRFHRNIKNKKRTIKQLSVDSKP